MTLTETSTARRALDTEILVLFKEARQRRHRHRVRLVALAIALLLLVLAVYGGVRFVGGGATPVGRTSPTPVPLSQAGTVTGTYKLVAAIDHPVPGTIVFSGRNGERISIRVGAAGTFTAHLPAGRYLAVGHSPMVISNGQEMTCHGLTPVVVRSGRSAYVTVVCQGI